MAYTPAIEGRCCLTFSRGVLLVLSRSDCSVKGSLSCLEEETLCKSRGRLRGKFRSIVCIDRIQI